MKIMNKKGASLAGWTEVAVGVILIMLCVSVIIGGMNSQYNKNYDTGFGLPTETSKSSLNSYKGNLQDSLNGEASTNAIGGVNVVGTWGTIKAGIQMMWDFVNGQWIRNSIRLLNLGTVGDYLGWGLTLLYIFSIGFIFIKLIFKVKA